MLPARDTEQDLRSPVSATVWPRSTALGVSGTRHSGGQVRRDWDRIEWREGVHLASQMLLHPDVSRSLATRMSQMTRAQWTVRPAIEGDVVAESYARLVRECLGTDGEPGMLETPWEGVVAEAAQYVHFGAYLFEVIWSYSASRGIWYPCGIEGREPQSIDRWGDGEELGPVTQRVLGYSSRRPEPMPGDKVLLFTRGRRGTDWTGLGLYRAALRPYEQLTALEAALVSGTQRSGVLPPSIEVASPSAMANAGVDASTSQRMVSDLRDAVLRYLSGDAAVLVEMQDVARVRWQTDGFDPARAVTLMQYLRTQIAAAYGVEHMMLGQTETGARSVGEVHAGISRGQAVEDVEAIAATINGRWRPGGGLVGAIVCANVPKPDLCRLPTLWHAGLEPDRLAESLGSLPGLVQAGILTPDDGLETATRGILDAPPLAEGAERTPEERQASGSPLMAALARRSGR
jgi:hypothetical protein